MNSHDNFEAEINKEIQEGFIKQIADKILQGMSSLDNATEDVKRRWIWELLQNAKDVPNRFGGVSVVVELYKDKLLFKHNGDCFTIRNLTSLIQQVSSKDDTGQDPNVTGKFGTGFITTHLLSREFTIEGVVKSQTNCCKRFQMVVDRDAENSQEMMVKIKDALDLLRDLKTKETIENYEENRTEDDMDTVFNYPLTPETYEYAEIGVNDLLKVLPYSLLFIPLLKKVTVFIHKEKEYQKILVQRQGDIKGEGIEIVTISKSEEQIKDKKASPKTNDNSTFIMNSKGRLNIVWPIEQKDNKTKVLRISVTVPKLFCSFPLIGSENFYQPMVINSSEFYPNEPRNMIFLLNQRSQQVIKNRDLLINANFLFNELVSYAIENNFEDFFNLFTEKPCTHPNIDHRWVIDSTYSPRIKFLLSQNLVKTVNGTQEPIKSMYFPKAATSKLRKNLWELYRKYFHDKIVIIEELERWYEVLNATIYALDIGEFTKKISDAKSLANMNQFDDNDSRIAFINELIRFIKETRQNDPKSKVSLSDHPIIPNINGVFVPQKKLLSDRENPIPKEIKMIYYELFEKSLDDFLIHHSITIKLNDYQSFYTQNAIDKINKELSTLKDKALLRDISKMMTELVPIIDDNENSKRIQIINYMNDLGFDIKKKVLVDLPLTMWNYSDPVVFDMMLEKIISFGKSNSLLPVNLLAQTIKRDIDDTMKWMNNYINFMRDNNFNKVVSSHIIPRQDSYFGILTYVYLDENLPETIVNILSNDTFNIKSQLIDKRITCFKGHQKMDMNKICDEIIRQIDMDDQPVQRKGKNIYLTPKKNPADVYTITMKLICLQSITDNELRRQFYDLIEPINFYELIPQIPTNSKNQMNKEIIDSKTLHELDKCINKATQFLGKYIIQEMMRKENLISIKNIFKSSFLENQDENEFIKKWYIDFLQFMVKSQLFHRELVTGAIYLNQNGKFISREASIDVDHDENLLSLSKNSMFNVDYKGVFVIPEIADILDKVYNGFAKKISREEIAKRIDDVIIGYQGNKQDGNFVHVILQIHGLLNSDPKYIELFPKTSSQMDKLILNTLSPETLSSIAKFVSEGKSDILNDLNNFDTSQLEQAMSIVSNHHNINQSLETIGSLSDRDQEYLNQHPDALSNFIQAERLNEERRARLLREREEMARERERRFREMQELINARRNNPPPVPVYTRPVYRNIHQFTHVFNNPAPVFIPQAPPPISYNEKLKTSLTTLLKTIFKKVKHEEPNTYYCSLFDTEEDQDEDQDIDEYLIIPLIEDKSNGICLDNKLIEFSIDFADTLILFIVPSEKDFDEQTFKDDVKIISKIGIDLQDYNITENIGQLISINTEDFEFKGCEKYYLNVKQKYINNHEKSFDEWHISFKSDKDE